MFVLGPLIITQGFGVLVSREMADPFGDTQWQRPPVVLMTLILRNCTKWESIESKFDGLWTSKVCGRCLASSILIRGNQIRLRLLTKFLYITNLVGFHTISVILFHIYNYDLNWNLQHFAKGEAWKVATGAPEALERLRAAGGKIINLKNWYPFFGIVEVQSLWSSKVTS